MKLNEFDSLVWNYGASGTKELEGYSDRVKDAVIECWSRIQSELDEDDDDFEKMSKLYINGHFLDTKYTINFSCVDSNGYYTGENSMVCYDGNQTNTYENAMFFDTKEEAEKWISEHKTEWNGELSVN